MDISTEALDTEMSYKKYLTLFKCLAKVQVHKRTSRPFLPVADQPRCLYFNHASHPNLTMVVNSRYISEKDLAIDNVFLLPDYDVPMPNLPNQVPIPLSQMDLALERRTRQCEAFLLSFLSIVTHLIIAIYFIFLITDSFSPFLFVFYFDPEKITSASP